MRDGIEEGVEDAGDPSIEERREGVREVGRGEEGREGRSKESSAISGMGPS